MPGETPRYFERKWPELYTYRKAAALFLACLFVLTALCSCAQTTPTEEAVGSTPETASANEETASVPTSGTPTPAETPTPETPTPTETPEEEKMDRHVTYKTGAADPSEILEGKSALFCGDSIVMASTHDTKHQWWGWAGRINENYALSNYKNVGVDGASISNCRDTNVIVNQVVNNRKTQYDFIVLEGGVNDAWDSCEVGEMVDKPASKTGFSDFDLSTFAGGLENTLCYATALYPNAAVCYVICFKINSHTGSLYDMTEYVEMTKKCCDKWGVAYLDLYNDKTFENEFRPYTSKSLADGIHPNSRGYDILTKYIAQFMADVYIVKNG